MPKRSDIKKVMVIGSGPIVIGQAAEFDYAGTQACRALLEEGFEVVLVNSNPATIMTDKAMAHHIYLEPLNLEGVKEIIKKERPDSILPNLGGQTGLNLAMELAEEGFLDEYGVKLLGAVPETIKKAEDRQAFKDTMMAINQPLVPSEVVDSVDDAVAFAKQIGFPVIVRPAYTLGGSGGGIADDEASLREISVRGIEQSRVGQILIERCIAGWKEIEFEVMRDAKGTVIAICSMENLDPVGVHTGDSIVVAPCQTLADREYQMLRTAALDIITALGIEGGCNVQFALHTNSFEYAVIEVNPRVSRSSALASKATGYPIAKITAKLAIGYTLDELPNVVTGETCACFEPTIDYIVLKYPRWPFDKFVYGSRKLGTQMKATGEVMSIGSSFEMALMKALRSVEMGYDSLAYPLFEKLDRKSIERRLSIVDDQRIFAVAAAMRKGFTVEQISEITTIDPWFINGIYNLVMMEKALQEVGGDKAKLSEDLYVEAKEMGYPDKVILRLTGLSERALLDYYRTPSFKIVDTCAAEFSAKTPYYYSTYDEECETPQSDKRKILVIGSGPIRIGQGIEFDYCCVHCAWSLKDKDIEAIIINNNPETVSTDFDTGDRLYFEPLTPEDVKGIIEREKPDGAIVQFGGQTAIKLTKPLRDMGVKIIGTPPESVDDAEDREKFDAILEDCQIPRPEGETVFTVEEALEAAGELGYPVLVRPSYVLGGQGMEIASNPEDIVRFMEIINRTVQEHPILVDKYMMGKELEVDAICDGEDILIPGIMEHVERAGVHSGDSISVYPPVYLEESHKEIIKDYTKKLASALKVVGLVNVQYVLCNDTIYVIEVNPRSSRTVPYISKVTGVPMVELATRCMLGEKLKDMGFGTGIYPEAGYYAVKVPVFSFEKLRDVDPQLGPEMKSTGEVLGVAKTLNEALYKGLVASGLSLKKRGAIAFSLRDGDKKEAIHIAESCKDMGFKIYATEGTAKVLNEKGVEAEAILKLEEGEPNLVTLLSEGKLDYVICTSNKSSRQEGDGLQIRRKAVERGIPCLTSIDTAAVLVKCLESGIDLPSCEMIDINAL